MILSLSNIKHQESWLRLKFLTAKASMHNFKPLLDSQIYLISKCSPTFLSMGAFKLALLHFFLKGNPKIKITLGQNWFFQDRSFFRKSFFSKFVGKRMIRKNDFQKNDLIPFFFTNLKRNCFVTFKFTNSKCYLNKKIMFHLLTFFCNWRMPYIRASAVGGQPGT